MLFTIVLWPGENEDFSFLNGVVFCFNTVLLKVFPPDSISGMKVTTTKKQECKP